MRTTIILDDALIARAQELTGIKTKRAIVEEALRTLILLREQAEMRNLDGKVKWEGNLEQMRQSRFPERLAMLVVDTSVWIDYFNGIESPHSDYLHVALDQRLILVGELILAEILQGIHSDADFERICRGLESFNQTSIVNPILTVQSARNFRYLRQKGITVRKTIDSLIAAFCIEYDHELLHNDHDFDGYEEHLGLRVLHP